jgi:hypothetical protein
MIKVKAEVNRTGQKRGEEGREEWKGKPCEERGLR